MIGIEFWLMWCIHVWLYGVMFHLGGNATYDVWNIMINVCRNENGCLVFVGLDLFSSEKLSKAEVLVYKCQLVLDIPMKDWTVRFFLVTNERLNFFFMEIPMKIRIWFKKIPMKDRTFNFSSYQWKIGPWFYGYQWNIGPWFFCLPMKGRAFMF